MLLAGAAHATTSCDNAPAVRVSDVNMDQKSGR